MKKQLFFFIILLCSCQFSFSQKATGKYLFPMYPGDKSWKETRYPIRIKALEIPDSILSRLTNTQLIGACFEYPFFINLFAFDNYDEGFKNLCHIFNGYTELLKRKNIEDDLINFYDEMLSFKFKDKNSLYNEFYNPLKFYLIEEIISQDQIINNLDSIQRKKLFFICKEKFLMKKSNSEVFEGQPVFSDVSLKSTMLIIGKLVLKEKLISDISIITACQDIILSKSLPVTIYENIIEAFEKIYK